MADSENATFNTSRVLGNEIVKADDFNYGFNSLITNISKFAQMLLECKQDFVIGGKVIVDSGTNIKVEPIFGVCSSTGKPFGMTAISDIISITQDDYHSRVDILEAKGEWISYDEQQRAFNDLDTGIITYQNVETKQRLKVIYRVKNGVNDSVTAPVTDEGWIKIAEIKYAAGTTELSQSDILNITSDVAGLENTEWTNEKTKTYNIKYISEINERFRKEHQEDGTHKDGVIHRTQLDLGIGNNQINASNISITSKGVIGESIFNIGDSIDSTFILFANQFAIFYENYIKYGVNNFCGEITLSSLAEENKLTMPLIFSADGKGAAYCKIGSEKIFTITADKKIRMESDYIPTSPQDVVTKNITDSINTSLSKINNRVTALEITSDNTVYSNNTLARFSYVAEKIDVATTQDISLRNLQTIDSFPLSSGMLVLVKDQLDATKNGIYEVNENSWQRHSEFSTFDDIKHKFFVIENGTINKNKIFYTPLENFAGELGEYQISFSEYKKINTQQIEDFSITLEKLSNAVLDKIRPKGFVYKQYPGCPSPIEMGFYGTWKIISEQFAGLFERIEGGDAETFNKQLTVSSISGTTVVFTEAHGLSTGSLIVDLETNEQRGVASVTNDKTVVLTSAFTSLATGANVLILQNQSLPNITGTISETVCERVVYSGALYDAGRSGGVYGGNSYNWHTLGFNASRSNNIYGRSSNVRTVNTTVRLWKRIS